MKLLIKIQDRSSKMSNFNIDLTLFLETLSSPFYHAMDYAVDMKVG